ncbi:glycosyltransferase [Glycomyces sp. L485]|uniref:glycosyltransferase n=1 Tax=Glycomyces sp. L485 TaxID=2909235 RepID=UPI001F4BAE9A|nr:glycosyltransferase [Glycomyces sp. L485]MCH7233093.1 glycosyltransferase [Glycomyces sp. L485]
MGGTIRTTLNTATSLLDLGHEVSIVTCARNKEVSDFEIDPRIEVHTLYDLRDPAEGGETLSPADEALLARPSVLKKHEVPGPPGDSALMDQRVKHHLRTTTADVVVGTNAGMNLYLAVYGRRRTVRVAQEHLYLDLYKPGIRGWITSKFGKLDAIVTTTEIDAEAYRKAIPGYRGVVECVPNSVPACPVERPAHVENVIMAGGRIHRKKGFDTLARAFARVADRHPDWKLRIYGRGPAEKQLQQLVEDLRQTDRIELMGPVAPLGPEWAKAAIAVVPSDFESFGLTIVEAMGAGAPLICTRVPNGPLELVDHETNGLFVGKKDRKSLEAALIRLIEDPSLRDKLADAGRETARRFEPDQVVHRHVDLFERLLANRSR